MLTTAKRFFSSLVKATEDRMSNPVISTFAVSWLLMNWRPVLVLFLSSASIESKIIYIENEFDDIQFWLFWPLGMTVFYVLMLPFLQRKIETALKTVVKNRRDDSKTATVEELGRLEAIEKAKVKVERAKIDTTEAENFNDIIESQKSRIAALEEENKNLVVTKNKEVKEVRDELTKANDERAQMIKRINDDLNARQVGHATEIQKLNSKIIELTEREAKALNELETNRAEVIRLTDLESELREIVAEKNREISEHSELLKHDIKMLSDEHAIYMKAANDQLKDRTASNQYLRNAVDQLLSNFKDYDRDLKPKLVSFREALLKDSSPESSSRDLSINLVDDVLQLNNSISSNISRISSGLDLYA